MIWIQTWSVDLERFSVDGAGTPVTSFQFPVEEKKENNQLDEKTK